MGSGPRPVEGSCRLRWAHPNPEGAQEQVKPDPALTTAAPPKPKDRNLQELFTDGIAAFDAGKWDEAEKAFAKALEKAPTMVNAQFNLGVVAERAGNLPKAQAAYEAAHKLDPNHEPTLLNLGKLYRLQDKFDQAIALYETALKRRRRGNVIRLEIDGQMPARLQRFVVQELELSEDAIFVKEGMLGLADTWIDVRRRLPPLPGGQTR